MGKLNKRRSRKTGLQPGSLVHVGELRTGDVGVTVFHYDHAHIEEKQIGSIAECFPYRGKPGVTWINVDGIHNMEIIKALGDHYALHPLLMEDIANAGQRPKFENYGEYAYLVVRMLYSTEGTVKDEQLSLVLGQGFVISFQEERTRDVFDTVRDRLRTKRGAIRELGADYLMYSLLDAVVDNYFNVLEHLGDAIESVEEEILADPTPEALHRLHKMKHDVVMIRKWIWPLREVLWRVEKKESRFISDSTSVYLRDVYDHVVQVVDTVETSRDMLSNLMDVYLTSTSNRMNEVMKVLTIIATIFIPLTFIAGVYGMNFQYMPELEWRWGYFMSLGLMATVAAGLVVFFKRKNWI